MADLGELQFWQKGDTITADRLNQLVCQVKNISTISPKDTVEATVDTGGGGSIQGKFERQLYRMHTEDGVPVILDTWNMNQKCACGVYARVPSVKSFSGSISGDTTLKRIEEAKEADIYQKIATDSKGNVTKNELVIVASGSSAPCSKPWNMTYQCGAQNGSCGVIHHRIARIVPDCRIKSDTKRISLKYATIKTNDFFLPPLTQNVEREDSSHQLVLPLCGNTIPIRGLACCGGTEIRTCEKHLLIDSGIVFSSCATPHNGEHCMPSVVDVKWGCKEDPNAFGFGIFPNRNKLPYNFKIETYGELPKPICYQAGCAIECLDLISNKISVKPADSNLCQAGYVFAISNDSTVDTPAIEDGNIVLPNYITRESLETYSAGDGLCLHNTEFKLKKANSETSILGGVLQVSMDSTIDTPVIVDGVIKIPKSSNNVINPCSYTFDDWFIVTNNTVTLNEGKLDTLVNEAINELGVSVTGEGLVESTFRGNLVANTQGTLTLNTNVSYQ